MKRDNQNLHRERSGGFYRKMFYRNFEILRRCCVVLFAVVIKEKRFLLIFDKKKCRHDAQKARRLMDRKVGGGKNILSSGRKRTGRDKKEL